jgi:hypothetical protein
MEWISRNHRIGDWIQDLGQLGSCIKARIFFFFQFQGVIPLIEYKFSTSFNQMKLDQATADFTLGIRFNIILKTIKVKSSSIL